MIPKFRAWNNYHDEMILWDELLCEPYNRMEDFNDGTLEFMQSTGLHDKNGVEIFEGDIVKFQDELHLIKFEKYRFEADGFWRNWQDDPGDFFSEGAYKEYEVIGNVYQNHGLLGVV